MGIAGAGLSTAVSQYISWGILLIPYLRKKTQSSFAPRYFLWNGKLICNILLTGLPSFLRQSLNSISTMFLNNLAGVYGDAAIAAVSIVNRITMFLNCVTIGIGQGFQPVSSFNFGAKIYSRVKAGFLYSLRSALALMVVLSILAWIYAPQLVTVFRDDPEVIAIGADMMRIQCIGMCFSPIAVFGDMMFQSVGKARTSAFLASLRRGILLIPLLLVLTSLFGLTGLEWSQGIAEILTSIITIPFVLHFFHLISNASTAERQPEDTQKRD